MYIIKELDQSRSNIERRINRHLIQMEQESYKGGRGVKSQIQSICCTVVDDPITSDSCRVPIWPVKQKLKAENTKSIF